MTDSRRLLDNKNIKFQLKKLLLSIHGKNVELSKKKFNKINNFKKIVKKI